ncbi:MAG: excinuclease ABC subunit C, partial [Epsilonproteobacteria bacterium]|nr:excinuclease ABC subunit C [Campylobacterota bacterium]
MQEIKDIIRNLPKEPGVYQYFDKDGRLLYIGKAKDLSKRVKSYFYLTPTIRPRFNEYSRVGRMLAQAKYIDYILVNSEEDALILENSLIKQLKPRYNILLRDDKSYPYIYIDESLEFPRFEITRRVVKGDKIRYFGPFPVGAKELLESIYEFFPLVQKKSCLRGKKACLFFEIKRCLAPCEGRVSKEEYKRIVESAKRALRDRRTLIKKLEEKMGSLALQERFEEAAKIRDRIEVIKRLQLKSEIDLASNIDYDIFAIVKGEKRGVVVKIFVRGGRVISSSHTFFRDIENFDINEAYKQTLLNHYKKSLSLDAKKILVAHDFEDIKKSSEAISKIVNKKIKIEVPKSSKRAKLIELAIKNANELLRQEESKKESLIEESIKELCSLSTTPYRIEIFDNSHMMGEASVGAMVVWDNGEWDKSSFRRYELEAKDEYYQMRE